MDSSIEIPASSSVVGELPEPTEHKEDGDNIMTFQNGDQNDNSATLSHLSEPNLVTMQNVSTATNFPPQITQQHNQVIEVLSCDWLNCFQKFTSQEELVNHVNGSHILLDDATGYCCRWVGCTRNGKKFNAKYKMRIHVRSHTNEKPHECQICKKCFSRSENLKIHKRSHTGEKPYACPVEGCNKRYSNSSDRFKHSRTHIVDKPYVCKAPDCNKCYTDPSSLRKHARSHNHYVSKPENPTSKPVKAVISDVVMNSDPLVVCPVLPSQTQPVITQVFSVSPQYIPISHLLSLIPPNSVDVKPVNNLNNYARTDLPLKGLVANKSEQRIPELKKENASILSTLLTKEQNKIFLKNGNIKPQFQVKTSQHSGQSSSLASGQSSSLVTVIST